MPTPGTLRITNQLLVTINVTVSDCYCQDAPPDGLTLVALAAGASQDMDFCRRGGHGCDGNQGSFTMTFSDTETGIVFGQQGFNFDSGGYIGTNAPYYRVQLTQIGSSTAYDLDILDDAWIGSNWNALQSKSLSQICLPGTHDSGTYDLGDNAFPNDADQPIVATLWDMNIDDVRDGIRSFAQTQYLSIAASLSLGVRYFDFRVNITDDGTRYLSHFVQAAPLSNALSDIVSYLNANPYEVVVVKSKWMGPADGKQAYLDAVKGAVGGLYVDLGSSMSTTLQSLKGAGTRFVFADQATGINTSSYGSHESASDILNDLTTNYAKAPFTGQLWEAQMVCLPETKTYVIGVADGISVGNLVLLGATALGVGLMGYFPALFAGVTFAIGVAAFKTWAAVANPPTTMFNVSQQLVGDNLFGSYGSLLATGSKFPNLVICDFIETSGLVEMAVGLSVTGTTDQAVLIFRPAYRPVYSEAELSAA